MLPGKETLCPETRTDIDKPHWNRRLPTHSQTYTHPPQPKYQCHCFEHSWPLCFTYLSHSATVELCSFIQRGCATHRAVYRLRQSACVLSFWAPFISYTIFLKALSSILMRRIKWENTCSALIHSMTKTRLQMLPSQMLLYFPYFTILWMVFSFCAFWWFLIVWFTSSVRRKNVCAITEIPARVIIKAHHSNGSQGTWHMSQKLKGGFSNDTHQVKYFTDSVNVM